MHGIRSVEQVISDRSEIQYRRLLVIDVYSKRELKINQEEVYI